ncbi:MAG: septum formation family protein [Nocardioidaceae bacterium]|nr:septum formation family protein [Nocardioidaceae bacterium]
MAPDDPAAGPSPSEAASPSISPTTGPSPSPSTKTEAAPDPPPDGACYRLSFAQATEPTNRSRPVPCGRRHDAQTIFVGRLDTRAAGRRVAFDSRHVQRQLARVCPRRLAARLGGTAQARELSRYEVVWFSPTVAETQLGARWFRCDAVALAAAETLAVLPPPNRLRGILETESGRSAYGLCGTAAPGAGDFERVICSRSHSWRALATIPMRGGRKYPGVRSVRRAGGMPCTDRAREHADDPLTFEYGWEWPTREQWRVGQRFGYCWVPD